MIADNQFKALFEYIKESRKFYPHAEEKTICPAEVRELLFRIEDKLRDIFEVVWAHDLPNLREFNGF